MVKDSRVRLFEMMERVSKMSVDITETYFTENGLNEIDIEKDWSDMGHSCVSAEDFKEYLNYILDNYNKPTHKREKPDLMY